MQICDAYQIKLLYTFSHSLKHFFKPLTLTYVPPPIQMPNIPFHASIEQKKSLNTQQLNLYQGNHIFS